MAPIPVFAFSNGERITVSPVDLVDLRKAVVKTRGLAAKELLTQGAPVEFGELSGAVGEEFLVALNALRDRSFSLSRLQDALAREYFGILAVRHY
jgi:hypothetical protein